MVTSLQVKTQVVCEPEVDTTTSKQFYTTIFFSISAFVRSVSSTKLKVWIKPTRFGSKQSSKSILSLKIYIPERFIFANSIESFLDFVQGTVHFSREASANVASYRKFSNGRKYIQVAWSTPVFEEFTKVMRATDVNSVYSKPYRPLVVFILRLHRTYSSYQC